MVCTAPNSGNIFCIIPGVLVWFWILKNNAKVLEVFRILLRCFCNSSFSYSELSLRIARNNGGLFGCAIEISMDSLGFSGLFQVPLVVQWNEFRNWCQQKEEQVSGVWNDRNTVETKAIRTTTGSLESLSQQRNYNSSGTERDTKRCRSILRHVRRKRLSVETPTTKIDWNSIPFHQCWLSFCFFQPTLFCSSSVVHFLFKMFVFLCFWLNSRILQHMLWYWWLSLYLGG